MWLFNDMYAMPLDTIVCFDIILLHNIYEQRIFYDNTLSIREICNDVRYKLDIKKKICKNQDKQMNFGK